MIGELGDKPISENLDLVVANFETSVSILLGDGNGNFGTPTAFDVGNSPVSVAVGSFNSNVDDYLDLAVSNYWGNNVSILPGDGNGNFNSLTTFQAGFEPSSIAAGEFNTN